MENVLLAKPYKPEIDPFGWWMSEKLDGIRATWDGNVLRTRNGNGLYAPQWFFIGMPHIPNAGLGHMLDGELWAGRGQFQKAVSIVRSSNIDKGWRNITYMVFDIIGTGDVFEDRQRQLDRLFPHGRTITTDVVKQCRCTSRDHLKQFVDDVIKNGGEGAMLRQPHSKYEFKRSSTLLKVKRFHDCEALVVDAVPGKGKHKGRMGALKCCLKPGYFYFEVGTGFSDAERENPPKKGDVITVRYQELTDGGIPRFPVFVSKRNYE